MRETIRSAVKRFVGALACASILGISAASLVPGVAEAKMAAGADDRVEAVQLDRNHPAIKEAMAVQKRHTPALMGHPDVVGTATGLDDDGQPAILVFTRREVADGVLPRHLEGKRVIRKVTGDIVAMAPPAAKVRIDPKSRFPRPVPIGVSTGNAGECSAGTIGARVKDSSGSVFALSNNHVYALENEATRGDQILQPGRYDTKCAMDSADVIGTLHDYVPIDFGGNNVIDAAIAATTTANLGTATPQNGYGTPRAATTAAVVGDPVQKYGRTTSLTRGTVVGINTTIRVGYSSGVATFVEQITVNGKSFIRAGDSGSLLVTDPGREPVGLLFAGNGSGSYAFANPIQPVLDAFKVDIDGE
jgi:hypothetical protein